MTEALRLLGALASWVGVGWIILKLIDGSNKLQFGWGVRLALSYPLGVGGVVLQMFWYALVGIPFHVGWILAPWGVVGGWLLLNRPPQLARIRWSVRLNWAEWIAAGFIGFQLFYVFVRSLSFPIVGWDAFSHWVFRGSAYFIDRGLSADTLFFDYPLLISLGSSWIYLCLGEINDQLVKILHPSFYLSLLVVFGATLRVLTTRTMAFILTAMLSTLPVLTMHAGGLGLALGNDFVGYSDLALAFYFLAAVSFFCLYVKSQERPYLTLSFIWLGLAAWTKNEGIAFATFGTFCTMIALFVSEAKADALKKSITGLAIVFCIVAPWLIYLAVQGVAHPHIADLNLHTVLGRLDRLPLILTTLGREAVRPELFNLSWPIFLLVLFVNPRTLIRPSYSLYLYTLMVLMAASYILMYLVTPWDLKWQLATTTERFILHLTPMALLVAAVNAYPLLKGATANASGPGAGQPAV